MEGENSNQRLQQAQAQVGEVVDIMRVNVEKVNTKNVKLSGHKWLRGQNSADSGCLDWDPHFFLQLVRPWKNAGQGVGTYLNYESAKALVLINGIY